MTRTRARLLILLAVLLTGCTPADVEDIPGVLQGRDRKRYLLTVQSVDFDALTRNPNWFLRTSTWNLYLELQRPESTRLATMAVLFHTRLTRPLLGTSSRSNNRRNVDLPEPDGPMRKTNSPLSTSTETFSSAGREEVL